MTEQTGKLHPLRRALFGSPSEAPAAVRMSDFSAFFSTPMGERLLEEEQALLGAALSRLVAYNCLQLSVGRGLRLGDGDSVGHFIPLGYGPAPEQQDAVWVDYQSLPVVSDCADIVLLHHVMEFSSDPMQLLREADRTLKAGGSLLLLGFNPFSSWPLYSQYRQWRRRGSLGQPHSIRQGRVNDWLAVLNYDIVEHRRLFCRPPVNSQGWVNKTNWIEPLARRVKLPLGLVYFTLARKRAQPVNPLLDAQWRQSLRGSRQPARVVRLPAARNNDRPSL